MSVGHVARALEEAGIPTVTIMVRAFRPVAEAMHLPRTLITRHPMGRPLGAPGDVERQREVLEDALKLFEEAASGATVIERPDAYRPGPAAP
ncbi:MAG: hypothetical protein RQ745_14095 [Longimicrobiales bacterium]|nr:hypothetical protein [Longimicrobiales bacterium]